MKNENQRGFTLVEVLIASTLMVLVFISVFGVIISTQRTHLTENRKLDMNQAARGLDQFMVEPCREAGAVLTMLNSLSFLGVPPAFNGILPLNNTTYPDGMMYAAGDPDAITTLTADFTSGGGVVSVVTTNGPLGTPVWKIGDLGMLARGNGDRMGNASAGFLVFRVTAVAPTQLTVSVNPAYYSGLLATANYDDPCDAGTGTYAFGSPVIRLDSFAFFLVRTEADGTRTLVMVNDFNGIANILAAEPKFVNEGNRMTGPIPILPNLQDLQLSYILADGTASPAGNAFDNLINKAIRSVRLDVLLRTDEATEAGKTGQRYRQPAMGDSTASGTILTGRYHYHYMTREVGLRNFPIQF